MIRHDVTLIDRLADIPPGGAIDLALRQRAEARNAAEDCYRRLLHPAKPGRVSLAERRVVAAFVAVLLDEDRTRDHFLGLLRATAPERFPLAAVIEAEAEGAANIGPYGTLAPQPVSAGDLDGPAYRVTHAVRAELGERLAGALEYAHRMALYPGDAPADGHARLALCGWQAGDVAVLEQIVDLVAMQARIIAGLRGYMAAARPHAIAAE